MVRSQTLSDVEIAERVVDVFYGSPNAVGGYQDKPDWQPPTDPDKAEIDRRGYNAITRFREQQR